MVYLFIGFSLGLATAQIVSGRIWKFIEFREKIRLASARIQREAAKAELRSQQLAVLARNERSIERMG